MLTLTNHWEKKMKRKIVIQGAEGGKDAKLFVTDLAQAYAKLFERKH